MTAKEILFWRRHWRESRGTEDSCFWWSSWWWWLLDVHVLPLARRLVLADLFQVFYVLLMHLFCFSSSPLPHFVLHYLYRRPDTVIDNLSFAGEVGPNSTTIASKLITKCKSLKLEVNDELQNVSSSSREEDMYVFRKINQGYTICWLTS